MANIWQEIVIGVEVIAEITADEAQLTTATPNTPVNFPIPAGKIIRGIGKTSKGKRIDLVGLSLQVEP